MEIDITDRIEQILKEYNLTPSAFSDLIQVQRSAMSHILSRRNRPSLDVIQKILKQFPEINSQWILTGTGKMKQLSLFEEENENTTGKKQEAHASSPEVKKSSATTPFQFKYEEKETGKDLDFSKNANTPPLEYKSISPQPTEPTYNSQQDEFYHEKRQNNPVKENPSETQYYYIPKVEDTEKNIKFDVPVENEIKYQRPEVYQEKRIDPSRDEKFSPLDRASELPPFKPTERQNENERKVMDEAKAIAGNLSEKEIARIVIFYKDKTFSAFTPE